jgi:glyoxylase-like metal-dependent hydrolase (beta-lactamase superfamily II)
MLVTSLLGNGQRLDGGALFGNAARTVWSRWLEPDALGRVSLACRVLLVEHAGVRTLFETGIGAFFSPELRERYGVFEERHVLLESLAAVGLSDADIDRVVLSHLHFDHAGGLLLPYAPDRAPALAFPRAEFVVGRQAFERAERPHPRDRASFIPELTALLRASGRLRLLDTPSAGRLLLGEGFDFRETDGHTPGMLHGRVRGRAAGLLFCADLVPGTAWVHAPITMGYDRFAERLVDEKSEWLAECASDRTYFMYTHDPVFAASRVTLDARGRYTPTDRLGEFTRWDLDHASSPATATTRVPTSE